MKHISEGQLRAFYDDALAPVEREQVQAHLATCSQCVQLATTVEQRAMSVNSALSALSPHIERAPLTSRVARQHFNTYLEKSEGTMFKNLFSRRYRPMWGAITMVLLLTLSLTFAPVRTLASNFLALFRVQKIQFVEFNPLNLPDDETLESAAMEIDRLINEEAIVEQSGETQTVDEATARTMAAFPVRFPNALTEVHQIDVQPATHIEMQVDLPRIQALFDAMGYDEIDLPESLDGAVVGVDIDTSITASYGACSSQDKDDCTLFIQMLSPNVSAPPELDVEQLGQLYLQMLGMSASEAKRFSQNIDWTTTLVVPIPSDQVKYEDVSVDGVKGSFAQTRRSGGEEKPLEYALMWVKDDIVYALIGSGDKASALEIARSLE
ncbi:MAG: zf-HC2 domain-containing protein [Anaerolineae bacterium]|nr:zf-HC2 domain-containing protein [Anaerolineae bacterium]